MKLGEILKEYRNEHGLSQREFAKICGLSNSSISILEMGYNPQTGKKMDPDLRTYRRLADGMGITVEQLFDMMKTTMIKNTTRKPHVIGTFTARDHAMPLRVGVGLGKTDRVRADALQMGIGTTEKKVIVVDADPQLRSMMKLWKVSSPKTKAATLEIMKLMNEKED